MPKKKIETEEGLYAIRRRFQFTEADVRRCLKQFAAVVSTEKRSSGTYATWRKRLGKNAVSRDTIARMYGSFESACDEFEIPISGKKHRYTDEELLEFFDLLWRWRKQAPTLGDFRRYKSAIGEQIHYDVFRRRFGSYKKFVRLFSEWKLKSISKKQFLDEARPTKVREQISSRLRYLVLKRSNSKCVMCGANENVNGGLEIDHIVPASLGGTNEINNLQVLCRKCNNGRSNRP